MLENKRSVARFNHFHWLILGVVFSSILGAFVGVRQVQGQAPIQAAPAPLAPGVTVQPKPGANASSLPVLYFGKKACATAGCHESTQKADENLVCKCNELTIWDKNDKHGIAFEALKGELGQRMLKKLKIEDPAQATACISCHGAVVDEKVRHSSFSLNEGVSCVVCHGAHKEWVEKHSSFLSREEFRNLGRDTKETLYGMKDLWDPVKRAQMCASCHIGNQAQGKVVTHEMYAAGHPPLPGFEVTTFSDQMPRHWDLMREKSKKIQEIQRHKTSNWEQTQLLLVGSMVGLSESMKLLEAQAEQALKNNEGLDWANFDCYACHHDLKLPSWRQSRGYSGRPGRIPMKSWPMSLAGIAADLVGKGEKQIRNDGMALEKQLREGFEDRPFGNLEKIRDRSRSLGEWADRLARQTTQVSLGKEEVAGLLRKMPEILEASKGDYDSARQAAWALKVLVQEESDILKTKRPGLEKLMDEIDQKMGLKLPSGRIVNITAKQGELLKTLYSFSPEWYEDWVNQIRNILKDRGRDETSARP